ncbi:FAD-dependent oxidoreductase [Archaeoglobus veneficus]|uniref:CoA-disulfide reductase n=1 Tax=Archaeoglobus veneficus (strain DSM 11195 / SNP6) TaxID=693661 RepID=F2KRE5_ARCVS|nr:FAD-dependent oxidoreductase [Archaeoglobus veneficus]AEA47879.1 CoA-disulfide reductase [Archaeoglobus veneficus SNP6]
MTKIVVIGGGAAGLKAAARARRRDEEAEITVIEAGEYPSMSRCGLPYYIEGLVHEIENLLQTTYGAVRTPEFFKRVKNIDVLTKTKAKRIDREKKVVEIERNGSSDELPYDYLVIATGSKPARPQIPGIDAEGVVHLHSAEDAEKIVEAWEDGAEEAVIIGGGLIGMECAEALSRLDMKVTMVEIMDHILPTLLDAEMAALVKAHLKENGVEVLTGYRVEEIVTDGEAVSGVKIGEKVMPAQLVLIATGVRPNVELAKSAGLEIGETGAIKVNKYLQTSDPSIYAGGDCVENIHILTGKPIYAPLGSTANKHGRVMGDNVTGGKSTFPGVIGTTIFKVFDFTVARTGLTEKEARQLGYDVITAIAPSPDRFHHYPGQKPIRVKIIADKSGKLLGAQAVGLGVVDKRIDVLATAIQMGATIDDVANLDLAYAPPFSMALDTVIVAANIARNKRDGLIESISAEELRKKIESDEDFIILDVRTDEEAEKNPLEDRRVIHIPLDRLRESVDKLPKDREIFTVCQVGARGYEAARFLIQKGFRAKMVEGGMAILGVLVSR